MTHARNLVVVLIAGLIGLSLVACNTIEGAGQDISNGGKAITGAAQKVKDKIDE